MKTSQIIECFVDAIFRWSSEGIFTYSLPEFERYFSENRVEINKNLSVASIAEIEFKTDALVKLMNLVSLEAIRKYGVHSWNKEYIRGKYGKTVDDCNFVYYPAVRPKRLIINFSSMGKDRFDRYSRYWDETQQWDTDSAYVFFKDDDYKYYLGDDENPKTSIYNRLIKQFLMLNDLTVDQAFTVGGSMGGYAALYYAIIMGLKGAVVCAPQTTLKAMQAHQYRNWLKHARSTGAQWSDLDMLVHSSKKTAFFYIEHGSYDADILAVEALTNELRKKDALVLVRRARWKEHTVDEVLSKHIVEETILYFEKHFEMNDAY